MVDRRQTFGQIRSFRFNMSLIFGLIIAFTMILASNANAQGKCEADNIVSSSVYFVPHEKDYGGRNSSQFRSQVKMQGTGTLSDGRVLRYNGKIEKLPSGCNTAVGAAGRCMLPFFSIAADPRFHRLGDIIYIPELAGQTVQMPPPDSRTIVHPGYFRVDDVGGAIKGANRFDFFTGSCDPNPGKSGRSCDNPWGIGKKLVSNRTSAGFTMADKNSCDKTFSKVNGVQLGAAMAAIETCGSAGGSCSPETWSMSLGEVVKKKTAKRNKRSNRSVASQR